MIQAVEGTNATITVLRGGGSTGAVSVQYSTTPETATPGDDYLPASGTLNWANGDSSPKTFMVQLNNDPVVESVETVKLELTNAVGAPLGNPNIATLKIINAIPSLTITDVTKAEGNSGTTNFVFDVNLSMPPSQTVTVNYSTNTDGSATVGNDFQPTSGVLTFTPGQMTQQIIVQVNGDTDVELAEEFYVDLSNQVNAGLGDSQGTGVILNDDGSLNSTVQFNQANFNVQEDLGALTVTVTRSGDTSSAASVSYKTNDRGATQKSDFEYAGGRIKFAPGETSKTFTILLNEDMYIEGNETFTISLQSPTGATLGQQSSANVVIADDAPESSGNPIDNGQAFVSMQYHDFLNREPDASGLSFWTNEITSCGLNQQCIETKRTNVSAAFFLSIEFQETGYPVYRTHKAAFGSLPNAPTPVRLVDFLADTQQLGRGLVVNQQGWQQILESNKQGFMLEFVQRSDFGGQYPTSLTPAQFVDSLFSHAGVIPALPDRANVISQFNNAADTADVAARARAVRLVAENQTLGQQEFNKAFVLMQYFGYLRRNPNDAPESGLNFDGYNFWLNKLNLFNGNYTNAEMVKAFILSGEYRQRFGM